MKNTQTWQIKFECVIATFNKTGKYYNDNVRDRQRQDDRSALGTRHITWADPFEFKYLTSKDWKIPALVQTDSFMMWGERANGTDAGRN